MVSASSSDDKLQLYPWRDGYEETRKLLESQAAGGASVKTVHITADEQIFDISADHAVDLFEAIGSSLTNLESVNLQVSSKRGLANVPPLAAIVSLLLLGEVKIKYLSMIGVSLQSNDLEFLGFMEAIRIHPTLHSFVVKECVFASHEHLELLRRTLTEKRSSMKHTDLDDNHVIVESCWVNDCSPTCSIL